MKDIAIIRMAFPNDPTKNLAVHQMFIAICNDDVFEFYSVSSILGKESRVYGEYRQNYFPIIGKDQINNGFRSPSFIDCAKSYVVQNPKENYNKLSGRSIDNDLKFRICERISECKQRGVHVPYLIEESDLKRWNHKL